MLQLCGDRKGDWGCGRFGDDSEPQQHTGTSPMALQGPSNTLVGGEVPKVSEIGELNVRENKYSLKDFCLHHLPYFIKLKELSHFWGGYIIFRFNR